MHATNLRALCGELLEQASAASAGRAARTLDRAGTGGFTQTVLALTAGAHLAEHDAPESASLYVLQGDVRFEAGDEDVTLGEGDRLPIPPLRHAVTALTDAALLLTVTSG